MRLQEDLFINELLIRKLNFYKKLMFVVISFLQIYMKNIRNKSLDYGSQTVSQTCHSRSIFGFLLGHMCQCVCQLLVSVCV